MENRNNVRLPGTVQISFSPVTPEQPALSVNGSLRRVVTEMRVLSTPYESAVHQFQQRYILAVLLSHSCHLGKAAEDLGMHRNTLTRVIRKLKIDPRQVRGLVRALRTDRAPVGSYAQPDWRDLGKRVKRNSELQAPRPDIGARPGG